MAFASKTKSKNQTNLPDQQLVVKVNTSKGLVTLGKIGLYNESKLHSQVANLDSETLAKYLSQAVFTVEQYSTNKDDDIELVI